MASILVNSLKRLYKAGRITKDQVADRVEKGTISAEDYETITGEAYAGSEAEETEETDKTEEAADA